MIGCGAVFPLIGEALDANGIFAIIGQSPCSSSSNHHCHVFSSLELLYYVEEVALGEKQKNQIQDTRELTGTSVPDFQAGLISAKPSDANLCGAGCL